jgi:hypothetical protein
MRETQLHYLWERMLLPRFNLCTIQGDKVSIISRGVYNVNTAGPDFEEARLKINDLEWFGSVEIHVKSSDWIKHGHSTDSLYRNVILHVVYTHDLPESDEVSNIPTLRISDYLSKNFISLLSNNPVFSKEILCKQSLKFVSSVDLEFFKEELLFRRLSNRTSCFGESNSPEEVLYALLADAFGRKVNKLPFQELQQKIRLDQLLHLDAFDRWLKFYSVTGIEMHNGQIHTSAIWKTKGLYPKGFPLIRIAQFSAFVAAFDFNYQFVFLSTLEIHRYLRVTFRNISVLLSKIGGPLLSIDLSNGIAINAIVPFIFWYGQQLGSVPIIEKSFELLRLLNPENNSIVRKWRNTPLSMANAHDTQAYITIYNEYCKMKRCGVCRIGCNLLGK